MAPSELKKLRNKQRKARRKAEQESAQAAQAQVKREQHNKSRQQADAEPDAPQLDELVPEKLQRCDDPLEQAARFLRPLQTLASNRVETHLMAFEIYYRKQRPLLMLQSIKRARRLDADHPRLHACLVRFHRWAAERLRDGELPEAVRSVIERELPSQDAVRLNTEYIERWGKGALAAAVEGAKMICLLDPPRQAEALRLVLDAVRAPTRDADHISCMVALHEMQDGYFGDCPDAINEYVRICHARFPRSTSFGARERSAAAASGDDAPAADCNHTQPSPDANSNCN